MDSGDHLHTGVVMVVWTTIAVVVGINLWRLGSAWLSKQDNATVAAIGRTTGALVQFGGN